MGKATFLHPHTNVTPLQKGWSRELTKRNDECGVHVFFVVYVCVHVFVSVCVCWGRALQKRNDECGVHVCRHMCVCMYVFLFVCVCCVCMCVCVRHL